MTISIRSLLFIFTTNADAKGYSSTLHVNFFLFFFPHSLCLKVSVKNNLRDSRRKVNIVHTLCVINNTQILKILSLSLIRKIILENKKPFSNRINIYAFVHMLRESATLALA